MISRKSRLGSIGPGLLLAFAAATVTMFLAGCDDLLLETVQRLNGSAKSIDPGPPPDPPPEPGSLDDSFLATGTGADNMLLTITEHTEGKILIGGAFTSYNGVSPQNRIARLNFDGSLDGGFSGMTDEADNIVASVAVQPGDGKILIGGYFTQYGGTSSPRIARLNSDGSLDDTTFTPGTGFDSTVLSVIPLSDGKILIGGNFTTYKGVSRPYLARLNSDGSLDTSFPSGGGGPNGAVRTIVVQPDGRILIGGSFTDYQGASCGRIARLETTGDLETSFLSWGAGVGVNNTVHSIVLQSDGKILIGGSFTSYNGIPRKRIARLNSDGSLDTTFLASGTGANGDVRAVVVQSDGRILIGGAFTTYNEISRVRVARLWN